MSEEAKAGCESKACYENIAKKALKTGLAFTAAFSVAVPTYLSLGLKKKKWATAWIVFPLAVVGALGASHILDSNDKDADSDSDSMEEEE